MQNIYKCSIIEAVLSNVVVGVIINKPQSTTWGFSYWNFEMKTCCKCKIEKYLIEFSKDKSRKDGFRPQCKLCIKEYQVKNADKLNQYGKQWRIDNPEKIKQWLIDNPEYKKKWNIDNSEYNRQYGKEWRQTTHGKAIVQSHTHKRRATLKANTPEGKHFTPADIILKLKLQKYKCIYCETSIKDYFEPDHFIPVSKGGSNEASNIQLLCKKCNRAGGKGAKLPTEYAQKHGKLL